MLRRVGPRLSLFVLVILALGCGPDEDNQQAPPDINYAPHVVLDLETVTDVDGAPDIADPHVIKVGPVWYLYATQTKKDLHVWWSDDLETWHRQGPVWTPTPGTWNDQGQVWAPHVEASDQGYYLYYTADMEIGVAHSSTPTGPFTEVHGHPFVGGGFGGIGDGQYDYDPGDGEYDHTAAFIMDHEEKAIDAFLLNHGGTLTFYFSAYTPLSVIQAVGMKDMVTLEDQAPTVLLESDVTGWEGFVAEGVWVVEHEGRFHLMYSGNGANQPAYAVGVAVGDDPLGPFVKYDENPILHQNPDAGFFGPGHHSMAPGAFDDRLMFYHTKVSAEPAFDRRIRYVPMEFDDSGHIRTSVAQP